MIFPRKARANTDALDAEEYDRWCIVRLMSWSISQPIRRSYLRRYCSPNLAGCSVRRAVIGKIQLLLVIVTLAV